MKKLLTAMSLVFGLALATAQQAKPAKAATPPPATKAMKADVNKKDVPAKAMADKKMKMVSPNSANSGMKLKKDGTPDRRYKGAQRLKKDGTPDKRYKENK